ncbi:hypothetical protein BKA64DRAFT_774011 [Cadophora sp. MPI-SDFR-AT-0126]|nr:hypothetical protein BKA64DRAFT_774011 [Leotiomycetes sp. MPI-SDFR-AT-0126]
MNISTIQDIDNSFLFFDCLYCSSLFIILNEGSSQKERSANRTLSESPRVANVEVIAGLQHHHTLNIARPVHRFQMVVAMSITTHFRRPLFQLVHRNNYKIMFLLLVSSLLIIALTTIIYKKTWRTDSRVEPPTSTTFQSLELSERNCDSYLELLIRYESMMGRHYELSSDLMKSCVVLAKNNEELMEKYGQIVESYRELAGALSHISEHNERIVQNYEKLSRVYGLMAMNFGYALRGCS